VLAELLSSSPHMVLFQETKLSNIIPSKLSSFMPSTLNDNRSLPATGSSGGLLTAWNNSFFSCTHHNSSLYTLSVYLTETSSNLSVCITNVYAPSTPELRPTFLEELKEIAPTDGVPWLICGDFNMIRFAHEKITITSRPGKLMPSMILSMTCLLLNCLLLIVNSHGLIREPIPP
jgi:hypothetical protein